MKLIEILARDLKDWPDDCALAISQAVDGDLTLEFHIPACEEDYGYRHSGEFLELASDWLYACVTREEWEAAQ